jgi:hypothetical protein
MSSATLRMGDVLLALKEAGKAQINPTRIQLQKFIYLTDVLGQIVGRPKPNNGHKTYKNGPYDPRIQNAVDALAFRGVARIAGVWRTPGGHLATQYALAKGGLVVLEKIEGNEDFFAKVWLAQLIGNELRRPGRGWARIVNLVYAEPTYVSTRPSGWGESLDFDNGLKTSSAFLIAAMRRVIESANIQSEVSGEWIVNRFFAYLDDFDANYAILRKEA